MGVARNVTLGLERRRVAKVEFDRRVAVAVEMVGLSDYAARIASQLPSGRRQCVTLACYAIDAALSRGA